MNSLNDSTVLIVDVAISTLNALTPIMNFNLQFGRVIKTRSCEQALEIFNNEKVDWIFSGIEMTGMTGLEFLSVIRDMPGGEHIPFVIMSSQTNKDTFAHVLSEGATDFIAKPFTPVTVVKKVQRILESLKKPRQSRRITLTRECSAQVVFSPKVTYASELINISMNGCLLRTEPFNQGGTIYDYADINIKGRDSERFSIKAMLVRLQTQKKNPSTPSRIILAAFRFVEMGAVERNAIKALLVHNTLSSRTETIQSDGTEIVK